MIFCSFDFLVKMLHNLGIVARHIGEGLLVRLKGYIVGTFRLNQTLLDLNGGYLILKLTHLILVESDLGHFLWALISELR